MNKSAALLVSMMQALVSDLVRLVMPQNMAYEGFPFSMIEYEADRHRFFYFLCHIFYLSTNRIKHEYFCVLSNL